MERIWGVVGRRASNAIHPHNLNVNGNVNVNNHHSNGVFYRILNNHYYPLSSKVGVALTQPQPQQLQLQQPLSETELRSVTLQGGEFGRELFSVAPAASAASASYLQGVSLRQSALRSATSSASSLSLDFGRRFSSQSGNKGEEQDREKQKSDKDEESQTTYEQRTDAPSKKAPLLFVLTALSMPLFLYLYLTNHKGEIGSTELSLLKMLPLRAMSRLWGTIHRIEFPLWLRLKMFMWWTETFGCNLDEMRDPLESYPTLNAFFTRRLKDGIRPLGEGMVSPVDGRVLAFGTLDEKQHMEQIKGVSYSLSSFVGEPLPGVLTKKLDWKNKKVNYCVIYLSPGDYHGFHSPTDWNVSILRHFPGYLFPVAPWLVKKLQGLFSLNERIVLTGTWDHGFFAYSPVGATNVGSIDITFPGAPAIQTNVAGQKPESLYFEYTKDARLKKGDEIGFFNFGSTIILIFEAPNGVDGFKIETGQKIVLGQSLFVPSK